RVIKVAFTFLDWNRKEQKVGHTVFQIAFDLSQRRRDAEPDISAQAGDWLVFLQTLDDKKWLDELRAIEFRFRAQVAQLLRCAHAHQAFHKVISVSHSVLSLRER